MDTVQDFQECKVITIIKITKFLKIFQDFQDHLPLSNHQSALNLKNTKVSYDHILTQSI